MDSSSFDRLTRSLAVTPSRRATLAGLVGALSALIARRGSPTEAAQPRICRPLGKPCFPERGLDCCEGACRAGRCRCPHGARPCRGRCLPTRTCCRNADCPKGRVCRQGRCQCPPGRKRCGKRCIATTACCRHQECGAHERCVNGRCQCAPGYKSCQSGCVADEVCCGGCANNQHCVKGTCEAKRCGTGGPCRVFVTSTTYTGALGGLIGADLKCQAHADAAQLGGAYKAWLSDTTNWPANRFTNTDTTGPYQLVDGMTQIALNWASLIDGNLDHAIDQTEFGGSPPRTHVWTKTTPLGTLRSADTTCNEWMSAGNNPATGGEALSSNSRWTQAFTGTFCLNSFALYCFEQG